MNINRDIESIFKNIIRKCFKIIVSLLKWTKHRVYCIDKQIMIRICADNRDILTMMNVLEYKNYYTRPVYVADLSLGIIPLFITRNISVSDGDQLWIRSDI